MWKALHGADAPFMRFGSESKDEFVLKALIEMNERFSWTLFVKALGPHYFFRAWRPEGTERPFLLDNVWEILHLMDYLSERPDVDPERIGITGE